MTSNDSADRMLLDLDRDVPTTPEDRRVLAELRRQSPGWLHLSAADIAAMVPGDALARRPPTSPRCRPFSLE